MVSIIGVSPEALEQQIRAALETNSLDTLRTSLAANISHRLLGGYLLLFCHLIAPPFSCFISDGESISSV